MRGLGPLDGAPRATSCAAAGDHHVLRVIGDSMSDEYILDGDYVIIQRRETVEDGEAAVVLVGDDASVKRIYANGPTVRLVPLNQGLPEIIVPAADVRIQGVVVGLMRRI